MTEPLPDTWHSRDLPVLRTIVRLCDESQSGSTTGSALAAALPEMGLADVDRAVRALDHAEMFRTVSRRGDGSVSVIGGPTGRARELSGAWPSPDSIADKLLAALEDIAEYGSDEVTKTKARKALDGLGGFSRDVLVSVVGAAAGVAMQ